MKTKTRRNAYLKLSNFGPFREIVMVGTKPVVVYPDCEIVLNSYGDMFPPSTELTYNSLTVKHKEYHESTSRSVDLGEVCFDWLDRKLHRSLPKRTQGCHTRQKRVSKDYQRGAREGQGAKPYLFLWRLLSRFFGTTEQRGKVNV